MPSIMGPERRTGLALTTNAFHHGAREKDWSSPYNECLPPWVQRGLVRSLQLMPSIMGPERRTGLTLITKPSIMGPERRTGLALTTNAFHHGAREKDWPGPYNQCLPSWGQREGLVYLIQLMPSTMGPDTRTV